MRHRFVVRVLPGLAVLALLCLAAAHPPAPTMPAPPPLFSYCPELADSGGGTSTTEFSQGAGVSQPLPAGLTVAACSLRVQATGWSWSQVQMMEWDPLALAPDPGAIALRSGLFGPSQMNYYSTNTMPAVRFVPPIVTRSLSYVAEAPRQTLSVEVRSLPSSFYYTLQAYFEAAGNSIMPAGSLVTSNGARSPLPGTHPVIAHAFCTGDADVEQLRIAQAVRRTDASIPANTQEVVQRFRVPQAVELRWIELALGNSSSQAPATGTNMPAPIATVAVVDGATLDTPSTTMPASLVEASFVQYFYYEPGPRWASHNDFDHTIVLQPGHDYWLYVHDAAPYQLLARTLTGGESAAFTAGVGPFYTRLLPNDAWGAVPDRALAFTVVGRPTGNVGGPLPGRDRIRLSVSPNPASSISEVSWSGGVGPVQLEVLDPRGRRVATGAGGAAGTWHWGGLDAKGTPLPSGVYFLRARDSAGEHAVERVVIVR